MADNEEQGSAFEFEQPEPSVESAVDQPDEDTLGQEPMVETNEDVEMGGTNDELEMDAGPRLPNDFGNEFSESLSQDFGEGFGDELPETLPEDMDDDLLSNLGKENSTGPAEDEPGDAGSNVDPIEKVSYAVSQEENQNPADEVVGTESVESPSNDVVDAKEQQAEKRAGEQTDQLEGEGLPKNEEQVSESTETVNDNDQAGDLETAELQDVPQAAESNDKTEPQEAAQENAAPPGNMLGEVGSSVDATEAPTEGAAEGITEVATEAATDGATEETVKTTTEAEGGNDDKNGMDVDVEGEVDSFLEQESRSASTDSNITVKHEKDSSDPKLLVPQTHEIVIPSYSKWFNLTKIHEIEVKSLPEFFTNRIPSKTPPMYVKYRNFMVNSYRLNPNEYFTVTAARRNLCGDAGALFRLHKFLTKWGLINYQVNATKQPKMVEPPFTGEYETRYDAPRGLFPFQSYKPTLQLPDMTRLKKIMTQLDTSPAAETSTLKRSSGQISNDKTHDLSKEGPGYASGIVNGTGSLGTVKENDGGISDPTGDEKNTSDVGIEDDRKPKRPKISQFVDKDWSQEETYKLIELIKEHGTDWFKIAKSVGTKTPEQCILRFLQLPIEDAFFMNSKDLGVLKFGSRIPFNRSDNPVMSTLAFLIGLVDPRIVQNLTKTAITLHDNKATSTGSTEAQTKVEQENKKPKEEEVKTDTKEAGNAEASTEKPKSPTVKPQATADVAPDLVSELDKAPTVKEQNPQEVGDNETVVPEDEQIAENGQEGNASEKSQEEKNDNKSFNEKEAAVENEEAVEKEELSEKEDSAGKEEPLEEEQKEDRDKGPGVDENPGNEAQQSQVPLEEHSSQNKDSSSEDEVLMERDEPLEKEQTQQKENSTEQQAEVAGVESEAKITVKNGTEVALATLGLRSHVFATNHERLMNKTTNDLINTQLTKVDLKLKTLDTMEKSVELERKAVHKNQEDLFIQRLSLAKYASSVMGKFESLLKQMPETPELKQQLEELRTIIADPPKTSITSQSSNAHESDDPDSTNRPISIESPQLYRYWSG
ncbi:unnamed protein product [Kluyveromyces dobzhanskii CBS 2104]|uniref:WGS project CCBQ000000000 data, contig 00107 n=1 Tax=Kluyveromyces dobzhanskii CBS 2104 TaxID=1427455 RepID=A0A0A8L127_9SACH|nr:unnamed protein product [Kluyveromyces dobzhanskii CBS 2104]